MGAEAWRERAWPKERSVADLQESANAVPTRIGDRRRVALSGEATRREFSTSPRTCGYFHQTPAAPRLPTHLANEWEGFSTNKEKTDE